MARFRSKLSLIPFFLFVGILAGGCAMPGAKSPDKVSGKQATNTGNDSQSDFYETVLGIGDTIDIAVYRSTTSELIIGIGDSLDITVYRSPTSEYVLGLNDSIDIAVYRSKTSEFIIGIGDSVDITVYRSPTSEYVLGWNDSIDIAVYRSKTSEFIIGIGDSVDITVYRSPTSEYVLSRGDSIDIAVYRYSEFDRSIMLDSAGIIMFPLIGDIQATGKKITELRDELKRKLSKYIVDPQVIIDVTARQALIEEDLSKSYAVSAQKNGKIMLPIIGEVQAAGKNVIEFRAEIQQKLSKYLIDPHVEVNLSPIQSLEVDDLTITTTIDSTGGIMFPILGDLKVAGMEVYELRDDLQKRLSEFIVDPQVTVSVPTRQALIEEDFSKSYAVSAQKNGKIMLPIIGEVQAAGKNVIAFRAEIQQKLSKYLVDPHVEVSLSPIQSLEVDDLTITTTIDSTGGIMFPILGDLKVAGMEVYELRDDLQKRLSEFIVAPQVTVNVTSIQSQKVHVLGEISSPGTIVLSERTTLWEAINKSGWFTKDANKKKVLLVRGEKDKVNIKTFNFNDLIKTGARNNEYLKNGDVIYVPPLLIANIEDFMLRLDNIISPLLSIARGIIFWPDVVDVLSGKSEGGTVIIAP